MSAKTMGAVEKHRTGNRMAEYLDNWQAQRKPKRKPGLVSYDWAAKRTTRAERAAHKSCMVYGGRYRDNFDSIFRKP